LTKLRREAYKAEDWEKY
jgi:hypothetical protein